MREPMPVKWLRRALAHPHKPPVGAYATDGVEWGGEVRLEIGS